MAEALGIAASVIAVIQMTDRIASICKYYIESTQDYPSELRVILLEITMLKTLFQNLQFLRHANTMSKTMSSLAGQYGPIEGCKKSISALEALFPTELTKKHNPYGPKKKEKWKAMRAALVWPQKEKRANKLLEDIGRYKATISFVLTTDSSNDVKQIKAETSKIHTCLTEAQRLEMCKWLQRTDPSPLHNRACSLYEPGTGDWMLRSPAWANWIDVKQRCIWVHGIPGAGKTILMSHLGEQIRKHCCKLQRFAYAYYYCYFGHSQDESVPFLGSLLSQLCRQSNTITPQIHEMYRNGGEPSLIKLLKALEEMLDHFNTVYVIIDALDESSPRINLLKVLRDLVTDARFQKIQLLSSSREYIDIEDAMETISTGVSMSNPYVEEDIRCHVRSLLSSNPRFKKWPKDILDEVEDAVTIGAKGMFRWAVCQIDALSRVKWDRDIVKATLANLPKTLDETYDRVLSLIPKEEQLFVYHALYWISFHGTVYAPYERSISSTILLELAERSTSKASKTQIHRFYDTETLRDLCGCLIHVSTSNQGVTFAHYTVKEYLSRTRVYQDPTNLLSVYEPVLMRSFLETIYTETLQIHVKGVHQNLRDGDLSLSVKDEMDRDLYLYCAVSSMLSLNIWADDIAGHPSTFLLAVDLLDPSKGHTTKFWRSLRFFSDDTGHYVIPRGFLGANRVLKIEWTHEKNNVDIIRFFSILLNQPNQFGSFAMVQRSLSCVVSGDIFQTQVAFTLTLSDKQTSSFAGTIMNILPQLSAHLSGFTEIFKYLLRYVTASSQGCDIAAYIASHNHRECHDFCPLEYLLFTGGDPNGAGYQIVPLQIAVWNYDYDGVVILLGAGADPNRTGDNDGKMWKDDEVWSRFNEVKGNSPLRILRHSCGTWKGNAERIENALLEHGAREFDDQ